MYLNLLLAFALLTALLFAVPVRWKAPITAVVTAILSVAAAVPAVKALASGTTTEITRMQGPVFGEESIAVDPLSGLFLQASSIFDEIDYNRPKGDRYPSENPFA